MRQVSYGEIMVAFAQTIPGFGNVLINTIGFPDNNIRPTAYNAFYESLPNPMPATTAQRVTEILDFTNPSDSTIVQTFPEPAEFTANYNWIIDSILQDGPGALVSIPSLGQQPAVGAFPPSYSVPINNYSNGSSMQSFSDSPQSITVPAASTIEAYIEAIYIPVQLPIHVPYRIVGQTRFAAIVNNGEGSVIQTNDFYGIGEICRPYQATYPQISILADDVIDVECGGTFTGQLFVGWNTVAYPRSEDRRFELV